MPLNFRISSSALEIEEGRKEAIVRPSERSYLHGFYANLHMILLEIYVITYKLINH